MVLDQLLDQDRGIKLREPQPSVNTIVTNNSKDSNDLRFEWVWQGPTENISMCLLHISAKGTGKPLLASSQISHIGWKLEVNRRGHDFDARVVFCDRTMLVQGGFNTRIEAQHGAEEMLQSLCINTLESLYAWEATEDSDEGPVDNILSTGTPSGEGSKQASSGGPSTNSHIPNSSGTKEALLVRDHSRFRYAPGIDLTSGEGTRFPRRSV